MRRFPISLALAVAVLASATAPQAHTPNVQTTPAASCPSTATLDDLIKAIDAAVSGPASQDRTCFRALLSPRGPSDSYPHRSRWHRDAPHPHHRRLDQPCRQAWQRCLIEHQIKVKAETWDHMAHRRAPTKPASLPTAPHRTEKSLKANQWIAGINSIQAIFDGKQWHIIEIICGRNPRQSRPGEVPPMTVATDTHVSLDAIRAAANRISDIAVKTPLVRAYFPDIPEKIWLKCESLQPIGSFKLCGASNKILQLTPEEISRGVITYSSGNHAQGVAYAARAVGAKAVIVMPSNAPAIKRAATIAYGAEVVDVGVASSERLAKAEELVSKHGYIVIPPYDDEQIITGQATCGFLKSSNNSLTSISSSFLSPAEVSSAASPRRSSAYAPT